MLTEIDTRKVGSGEEVTLYEDTDAKVYLVCVQGFPPITCLTKDRALAAYTHPYAYIPLEKPSVSPVSASEGSSATDESYTAEDVLDRVTEYTGQGIMQRAERLFVDLHGVLAAMTDADFHWAVSLIRDLTAKMETERRENAPETDIEF